MILRLQRNPKIDESTVKMTPKHKECLEVEKNKPSKKKLKKKVF